MSATSRIAFLAAPTEVARAAQDKLAARYGAAPLDRADVVVALGGDGMMLETQHRLLGRNLPVYGMNCGSVGFLMNEFREDALPERLAAAQAAVVHPLRMRAFTGAAEPIEALAINEVSLLRETRQTAKLEVSVNGKVRMPELSCDGVLVATPAGSTAYNLSANGPILPLGSAMLALTPISPFRPRRWRGAILPESCQILFRSLEAAKRPVLVVADQKEVRDISEVRVSAAREHRLTLLFDKGKSLDERIFAEQFLV